MQPGYGNPPSTTTRVYLYNQYARWLLICYCLATLGLFLFSPRLSNLGVGIYAAILFGLPIYTGIRQKSFFSIRSWDDRPLTISAKEIHWGNESFPVDQLSGLSIYIYSFDNFKHEEMGANGWRTTVIEDGDKNKLSFRLGDQDYDFTFYLSSYEQYHVLFQIIGSWQQAGIELTTRAAFEDGYIRQQMIRYGYGAHLGNSANSRQAW